MVQAAVLSYLPLYTIQALGFDPIGARLLVACSQAGGAVSRLVLGAASDRWFADRRSVWLTVTGAIGACSFASVRRVARLDAARRGRAGASRRESAPMAGSESSS